MDQLRFLSALAALAWVCTACQDETAPAASSGAPAARPVAENTAPEIRHVVIEPSHPTVGQTLRADVSTVDLDGDKLELHFLWNVDGRTLASNEREIRLEEVPAGARVEVRVTASDGLAEVSQSAEVRVADQVPVLEGLLVEPPQTVSPGDAVTASAQGRDPEGGPVDFEYEWTVNGEPKAVGDTLQTEGLRSGDEIQVTAWALDGGGRSEPLTSGVVRVGSAHPEIVSLPPGLRDDGVFEYEVKAIDPDGDRRLRYALAEGPEGMAIDEITGELRWRPTHAQTGVHRVKVVVRDSSRLETSQSFDVSVSDASESVPAAPDPAAD